MFSLINGALVAYLVSKGKQCEGVGSLIVFCIFADLVSLAIYKL